MTLPPSKDWPVAGVEGDEYKVGPYCDKPGCGRPVDHKHHLWSRTFLGKPYWWVRVPVGLPPLEGEWKTIVIRNVIAVCADHHHDLSSPIGGHKAWIKWVPAREHFIWLERSFQYDPWVQTGTLSLPAPPEQQGVAGGGREAERCPTCGKIRTKPHDHEPQPKRPRKTWTIKVPADAEDGAKILDELVEGCAEVFGHEDYKSALRRYYTVSQALIVVLQNRDLISAEVDAA